MPVVLAQGKLAHVGVVYVHALVRGQRKWILEFQYSVPHAWFWIERVIP